MSLNTVTLIISQKTNKPLLKLKAIKLKGIDWPGIRRSNLKRKDLPTKTERREHMHLFRTEGPWHLETDMVKEQIICTADQVEVGLPWSNLSTNQPTCVIYVWRRGGGGGHCVSLIVNRKVSTHIDSSLLSMQIIALSDQYYPLETELDLKRGEERSLAAAVCGCVCVWVGVGVGVGVCVWVCHAMTCRSLPSLVFPTSVLINRQ